MSDETRQFTKPSTSPPRSTSQPVRSLSSPVCQQTSVPANSILSSAASTSPPQQGQMLAHADTTADSIPQIVRSRSLPVPQAGTYTRASNVSPDSRDRLLGLRPQYYIMAQSQPVPQQSGIFLPPQGELPASVSSESQYPVASEPEGLSRYLSYNFQSVYARQIYAFEDRAPSEELLIYQFTEQPPLQQMLQSNERRLQQLIRDREQIAAEQQQRINIQQDLEREIQRQELIILQIRNRLQHLPLQSSQTYVYPQVQSIPDFEHLSIVPTSPQEQHTPTVMPPINSCGQSSFSANLPRLMTVPNFTLPVSVASSGVGEHFYPNPNSGIPNTAYGVSAVPPHFQEQRMTDDSHAQYTDTGLSTQETFAKQGAPVSHELRANVAEFVPSEKLKSLQGYPHDQRPLKRRYKRPHPHPAKLEFSKATDPRLVDIKQTLRTYAIQALVPCSDPTDPHVLEDVKRTVTRVPAVCFNEQKLEKKDGYQVLHQPQSPAVRGQEALSRVCFALEQLLRNSGKGAAIISDYKFKENYLRHAPPEVLEVLERPAEEGSHNILMFGPEMGIVCVQVTCVEASTNDSTVRKQVRDTLKQLQRDVKVIKHMMNDLDLDDCCINMVVALPNVTAEQLKFKLEQKSIQILSSVLGTEDVFEDLLTLDCLPSVGHRHWSDRRTRDKLRYWIDRLLERRASLSVEDYMQIFARYTCGWSSSEVWSAAKPRVQIRSQAHAVAETFRRYHLPVLTPEQERLLLSDQPRVLIEASAGSGANCLLKVKVRMELKRGRLVLIFVPRDLTGLKNTYRELAETNTEEFSGQIYFWSGEETSTGIRQSLFTSVSRDEKTLDELKGNQESFALFDHISPDSVVSLAAEMREMSEAIWIVTEQPLKFERKLEEKFQFIQLLSLPRLPTAIQILISHAAVQEERNSGIQRWVATAAGNSRSHPAGIHLHSDVEASIYLGLPTDGPLPRFIWHTAKEGSSSESDISNCTSCINQLRVTLKNLVPEFVPRAEYPEKFDEMSTAMSDEAHLSTPSTGCSSPVDTRTENEHVLGEKDEEKTVAEEASIDINSGNVPPPLTADDVVIFADRKENVVKGLDLTNIEKVIHSPEELARFVGTEKAVVCYIGTLKVERTDAVLHALLSQLRDIMALCQGQLILVLQTESVGDLDQRQCPAHVQPDPYQLDIDDMLEQARRQHDDL